MLGFLLVFFIFFLQSLNKSKKTIIFERISVILLIVFSGLRYNVGTDYNLYNIIFNNFHNVATSSTARTGILFSYLMFFVKFVLKSNYNILIFLCSFITIYLFYKYFRKTSSMPGLTLFLFISLGFYAASMNIFRQFLSMSFLIYGNYFLYEKKNKITVLFFWVISFLLHNISFVGIMGNIVIFFTREKKFPYKSIILTGCLVTIFLNNICNYIFRNISSLEIYFGKLYEPGTGTYLMIICYVIIYILLLVSKKKIVNLNQNNEIYYRIVTVGIILMIFELQNHLFYRLALYFIIYFTLLLTDYLIMLRSKNKKILVVAFYLICLIYYILYINSFGNMLPYHWIFK